MEHEHKNTRSLASLFSELATETTTLVRQQIALAKAEANEKLGQLGSGIASIMVGGAILIAALFYILDAVVYGIARLMPDEYRLWLAALIVGVVVGLVGLILVKKGQKNIQPENLAPRRTTRSVKLDTQMVKGQHR